MTLAAQHVPERFLPMAGFALQQTEVVLCPRSMIGRVIGKNGETIKALQAFTGAMIQIDQSTDPTKVTIAGEAHSLRTAVDMVTDIVAGNFKGFALLRQLALSAPENQAGSTSSSPPKPMYIRGYGIVPPTQQASDLEAESRSANAALGLALAENFRSSSLGAEASGYSLSLGGDGVRSLSLSSTGTAQYLGLGAKDSLQPNTPIATQSNLSFTGGPAAGPGLPGNWARLKDPEGRSFYYNAVTRESAWELPCRS
ncbi:hypothetical protein WJX81_001106 [Elliptochloris bilobata]|uniref:WW domain-containing protein n=1 Tax=Elliptochloris bilobata TaxID=381761 RepID=A0AAW1RX07_9CHLO